MGIGNVGFDPSKLNKLREDSVVKRNDANNFLIQVNQSRFNTIDTSDPLSKYGSIFSPEGTNGANAAQNSSSTVTNNQGNNNNNSGTQTVGSGENTVVTGSGTVETVVAIQDTQQSSNNDKEQDFTKQKSIAQEKVNQAKAKSDEYMSYLSMALSYDPNTFVDNLLSAVYETATPPPAENTEGEQQVGTTTVDQEDASDPTKTDIAYQKPDVDNDNKTLDQQILQALQTAQADARAEKALEETYEKTFETTPT